MATYSTKFLKNTVYAALRKAMRKRTAGLVEKPHGYFTIDTGTVTIDGASYNTAADEIEIIEFPDSVKVYLVDFAVTVNEWDDGVDAGTLDLVYQTSAGTESVFINDNTVAQAGGTIDSTKSTVLVFYPHYDVSGGKLLLEVATPMNSTVAAATFRAKLGLYCGDPGTLTGA